MMKAFLDGTPVSVMTKSLEKPTFVIRDKDENGENTFSFTGELEFVEADYDYLYLMLKTDPNATVNRVTLRFEDDCCDPVQVYEFYITSEGLNWCEGECRLTAQAVEKSIANDQIICLKNTMVYDNYAGFQQQQHPRMTYCNELRPNWMHHVIIILAFQASSILSFFALLIPIITLIVSVVNIIIGALNAIIPGTDDDINLIDFDGDPQTNTYQELTNFYNQLLNWIVGCGRKHPSPLVYRYAENVCGKCGLTFTSSIFAPGRVYRNTVYMNAPVNKGTISTDTTTHWIDENKPLLSGTLYFDQIKTAFNADWKIKNNILYFERHDLLPQSSTFLDLTLLDPDDIEVCWSWRSAQKYSYGNFTYFKDAVNWVGAEALDRWSDIVEWNSPYTPTQKGEYKPSIEFSACRFRDDGIDQDVLSFYKGGFGPIAQTIKKWDNVIIMNSHNCYQPMLLIWDPNTGVKDSKVSGSNVFFPGYPGVAVNQFYNYPFWFDASTPGNLYDQFFFIEDPRTNNFKGLEFKATVPMTCELLISLDIDGSVITSEGLSRDLTEININFDQQTITISGLV